jgi:hypothetical protein
MGGSCGREKSLPVLARSANLHESAHPFCSGRAENINRLARSTTMLKASKGASAPSKFISAIFNSKVPEGLTVTEREWENEYRGTEAAFLKAGFVKSEWLPGQPGNAKRRVTVTIVDGELRVIPPRSVDKVTNYQWQNGYICITKAAKGCLIVSVNCIEEEREKREEVAYLQRKKERIEEAREEIAKGIAELPTSPEFYLRRSRHTTRAFISGIRDNLIDSFGYSGGFGFAGELIAEFDSFVVRFNQLLDDVPVNFDQEKRQKDIAGIKKQVLEKYHGLTDEDLQS